MRLALLLIPAALLVAAQVPKVQPAGPDDSSPVALTALPANPLIVRTPSPSPMPPLTPLLGGHVTSGDPRNPAVMPEQRIDLKFTHRVHLEEADLGCTDCHETIPESSDASDFNVPLRSKCMDCHDAAEIPVEWSAKGGAKSALDMPQAHLRFSHQRHLAVDGVRCSTCHPNVAKEDVATRDDLPPMETCLTCHDGKQAPADCTTCHLKGRGGVVKTVYDSGELKPDDHGALWLRQHHVQAERDMGYCASCHAQEDCLTCHDGSIPPTFHDGNYIAVHPQDAQANDPPCASCHRLDTFCQDCHFRAQVQHEHPLHEGGFHPEGWLTPGDPKHHANMARKNLGACAGCHPGDDCRECHAFYIGAPRTHPAGWANSRRMERLRRENFALCLQCHGMGEIGDPIPPP